MTVLLTFFFLFCLLVEVSAQPAAKKCTADKTTIYLSDPDVQNDSKFVAAIRDAVKSLRENKEDKIFIYPYPRGAWGTKGVSEFLHAVRAVSERDIKDVKLYEIRHVGYRTDASVDIFVRRPGCEGNVITDDYKGDADATVERVDFSDAPLGESVFPTRDEWPELIAKSAKGGCDNKYFYFSVTFFIIVGKDGRVLFAVPKSIYNYYSDQDEDYDEAIRKARQVLSNWVFNTPVIDGTPRHIRGDITVEFRDGPCETRKSPKPD